MSRSKQIAAAMLAAAMLVAGASISPAQQPRPAEGDEAQLLAVIRSDADLFEKGKACQQLAVVGSKQAVPVLAPLLADEKLAHYARFALAPIEDPSVDQALRDAMARLKGGLLVGVIDTVGMRRDAGSVDHLITLLADQDAAVAAAAAAALGRIANQQSVAALRRALDSPDPLRGAVADACLTAAEALAEKERPQDAVALYDSVRKADVPNYVRIAALYGTSQADQAAGLEILREQLKSADRDMFGAALLIAHALTGRRATETLMSGLNDLEPARQALVIYALGDRGDKSALPVVLEAARHAEPEVRVAAIDVLASLGDASAVPVLLEAAAHDETAAAAYDSLAELPGDEVDRLLAKRLPGSDGPRRLVLIRLAGARGIASASPTLLTLADSSQREIQLAAIASLGLTVQLDDYPALVDRLLAAEAGAVRDATKEALKKASQRMSDREAAAEVLIARIDDAPADAQSDLLDLLGVVGGQKALEGVAAAAIEGNDAVQDAATRVLGQWSSPDAAEVLLKLAKEGSPKYQVRSLRGYIRVIRQFGLPDEKRLEMSRQALEVASRPDEEQLVLETLPRFPSPDALQLALGYVDDESLSQSAGAAAVSISEKIVNAHPAAVSQAMKKVIDSTTDRELSNRAKVVLDRAAE